MAYTRRRETEAFLGPMPPGWARAKARDGKQYFVDHANRATTWIDPRTFNKRTHDILKVQAFELPYGWDEDYDPEFGVFYNDHITHTTYVDPPWDPEVQQHAFELRTQLQSEQKRLQASDLERQIKMAKTTAQVEALEREKRQLEAELAELRAQALAARQQHRPGSTADLQVPSEVLPEVSKKSSSELSKKAARSIVSLRQRPSIKDLAQEEEEEDAREEEKGKKEKEKEKDVVVDVVEHEQIDIDGDATPVTIDTKSQQHARSEILLSSRRDLLQEEKMPSEESYVKATASCASLATQSQKLHQKLQIEEFGDQTQTSSPDKDMTASTPTSPLKMVVASEPEIYRPTSATKAATSPLPVAESPTVISIPNNNSNLESVLKAVSQVLSPPTSKRPSLDPTGSAAAIAAAVAISSSRNLKSTGTTSSSKKLFASSVDDQKKPESPTVAAHLSQSLLKQTSTISEEQQTHATNLVQKKEEETVVTILQDDEQEMEKKSARSLGTSATATSPSSTTTPTSMSTAFAKFKASRDEDEQTKKTHTQLVKADSAIIAIDTAASEAVAVPVEMPLSATTTPVVDAAEEKRKRREEKVLMEKMRLQKEALEAEEREKRLSQEKEEEQAKKKLQRERDQEEQARIQKEQEEAEEREAEERKQRRKQKQDLLKKLDIETAEMRKTQQEEQARFHNEQTTAQSVINSFMDASEEVDQHQRRIAEITGINARLSQENKREVQVATKLHEQSSNIKKLVEKHQVQRDNIRDALDRLRKEMGGVAEIITTAASQANSSSFHADSKHNTLLQLQPEDNKSAKASSVEDTVPVLKTAFDASASKQDRREKMAAELATLRRKLEARERESRIKDQARSDTPDIELLDTLKNNNNEHLAPVKPAAWDLNLLDDGAEPDAWLNAVPTEKVVPNLDLGKYQAVPDSSFSEDQGSSSSSSNNNAAHPLKASKHKSSKTDNSNHPLQQAKHKSSKSDNSAHPLQQAKHKSSKSDNSNKTMHRSSSKHHDDVPDHLEARGLQDIPLPEDEDSEAVGELFSDGIIGGTSHVGNTSRKTSTASVHHPLQSKQHHGSRTSHAHQDEEQEDPERAANIAIKAVKGIIGLDHPMQGTLHRRSTMFGHHRELGSSSQDQHVSTILESSTTSTASSGSTSVASSAVNLAGHLGRRNTTSNVSSVSDAHQHPMPPTRGGLEPEFEEDENEADEEADDIHYGLDDDVVPSMRSNFNNNAGTSGGAHSTTSSTSTVNLAGSTVGKHRASRASVSNVSHSDREREGSIFHHSGAVVREEEDEFDSHLFPSRPAKQAPTNIKDIYGTSLKPTVAAGKKKGRKASVTAHSSSTHTTAGDHSATSVVDHGTGNSTASDPDSTGDETSASHPLRQTKHSSSKTGQPRVKRGASVSVEHHDASSSGHGGAGHENQEKDKDTHGRHRSNANLRSGSVSNVSGDHGKLRSGSVSNIKHNRSSKSDLTEEHDESSLNKLQQKLPKKDIIPEEFDD